MLIVAYVWRCLELSKIHRINHIRFVQPKGIKGFSSQYARTYLFHNITKLSTFLHTHKNTHILSQ